MVEVALVAAAGLGLAIAAVHLATHHDEGSARTLIAAGAVVNTVGAALVAVRHRGSRLVLLASLVLLVNGDVLSGLYAAQLVERASD